MADLLFSQSTLDQARYVHEIFDDFNHYTTTEDWTSLVADTNSSVAGSAAANGILVLNTGDAADNAECGFFTTHESFLLANSKSLQAETYIQFTDTNNTRNVFFGFADAPAANTLLDNGGGVSSGFTNAICIYKVDGGTKWKCYSEGDGSSTDSTSVTTAGGSAYQRLRIQAKPVDGSIDTYQIAYFVDDVRLVDSTTNKPITHSVTVTNATEMDFGLYIKVGEAGTATMKCDYMYAGQTR